MRTNNILLRGFDEIKTLQQYLYLSEDHYIEIVNSIGVHLQIRMRDNLHYYCKNMNFPHLPESCWSSDMTNETMLAIIDQLKQTPAVEYPKRFNSRWGEIECITNNNLALNEFNQRR